MKFKLKLSVFTFLTLFASLLLAGCGETDQPSNPVTLEVWGVFDDSDVFTGINSAFTALNPNVERVNYRKISNDPKDYENQLINALANGNGPDVVFIHNTWLMKHQDKLAPLPESASHLKVFADTFVDVARKDFVYQNQIYAMPLYCDTLALFYNVDIFNQLGIVNPPATWSEVSELSKQEKDGGITRIDSFGNIQRSAIALGRSFSPAGINRSSDILMLMMMQSGEKINPNDPREVRFSPIATEVLNFYTNFARGNSDFYTWNSKMPFSIDAFRTGQTTMMLGYQFRIPALKKSDPKLRFEIAPAPQMNLDKKVNYADYWGLGVIKNLQSQRKITYSNETRVAQAWKYIQYVTEKPGTVQLMTPEELAAKEKADKSANSLGPETDNKADTSINPAVTYLKNTGKPTARKDLINDQRTLPELRVFVDQVLTADSWTRKDNFLSDEAIDEAIDSVISGRQNANSAIDIAASKLSK